MGIFYRIRVNGIFYQSKAIERDYTSKEPRSVIDSFDDDEMIEPGDSIRLSRKSMNAEEYDLAPNHYYSPMPNNYSVLIFKERDKEKAFIKIVNGKLTDVFEKDEENCFDYYGESIGSKEWRPLIKKDNAWSESRNWVKNSRNKNYN